MLKTKYALLLVVLLLASGQAIAGSPDTTTYGWHEVYPAVDMGLPWELYSTASGLYVLCDGYVLHTSDNGAAWNRFDFPACGTARAAAFFGANLAYLVGDNGLMYKSTDAGMTWVVKPPPFSGMNLRAISFVSPTLLYASGSSGLVLKSTDGGESWSSPAYLELFLFNPRGTYAFIKPVTDKILWLVRDSRVLNILPSGPVPQGKLEVLFSSDGGDSWGTKGGPWIYEYEPDNDRNQVDFATDGTSIKMCDATSISLVVNDGKTTPTWKTFRTTNTGASWDSLPIAPDQQLRFPHLFDCTSGWATDFFGTHLYRMAHSDNGSWIAKSIPKAGANSYNYDFRDSLTGYCLVQDNIEASIYNTTDGGAGWQKIFSTPLTLSGRMTALSFISPTQGFAIGEDATGPIVMTTTTSGTQWSTVSRDKRLRNIRGMQFANAALGWVYADTLYASTDGGVSWTPSTQLLLDPLRPSVHYVKIQFVNPQVGWAVRSDWQTYRTIDGGANWNEVHGSDTAVNISVGYAVNQNIFVAMGTVGNVAYQFRILDGGGSYQQDEIVPDINTPTLPACVGFADTMNGWFADTMPNLYRTYDGGVNWFFLSQTTDNKPAFGIAFGDTNSGWLLKGAYASDGVTISGPAINRLDQGGNTIIRDVCLSKQLNAMVFLSDTLGWCVGDNFTVYRYYLPRSAFPHHAPKMVISAPVIEFGYSKPGTPKWDTLMVYNVGEDTLILNKADVTGDALQGFQVGVILPKIIRPGDSIPFYVDFDPQFTFEFKGTLNIYTNADTQHVLMHGTGYLTGIEDHPVVSLNDFSLQGYPNPFREHVTVGLQSTRQLPRDATIKVYDGLGREVEDLTDQFRNGAQSVSINGSRLPAGRYVVRLLWSTGQVLRPLMLVR